jgi:two-component system chemotaxis response regulator CheY
MKIMVVDDEKDVEVLFCQKFRKELRTGIFCFYFSFSGEEALAYLKENGITDLALILSDINMPGMNGLELLRFIKEKSPDAPKVYMITAYGDDESRQRAYNFGCDDYITKPLDFERLRRCILGSG